MPARYPASRPGGVLRMDHRSAGWLSDGRTPPTIANTSGERDEVYRFETVPLVFATQMLAPSKATPWGLTPTANVPSTVPSLASNSVTVLSLLFATQMLTPSKATPWGPAPTAKVPSVAPSLRAALASDRSREGAIRVARVVGQLHADAVAHLGVWEAEDVVGATLRLVRDRIIDIFGPAAWDEASRFEAS